MKIKLLAVLLTTVTSLAGSAVPVQAAVHPDRPALTNQPDSYIKG